MSDFERYLKELYNSNHKAKKSLPAKKADDESEDTAESAGKSFKAFRKQLEEQVYMDETDSRMYGDDSVLKPSKDKPKPCKGKDCGKKPKPFRGYEQTEIDEASDDTDVDMTQEDFRKLIRDAYKQGYTLCKQGKDITKYKATIVGQVEGLETPDSAILEDGLSDLLKGVKDYFTKAPEPRFVMTVGDMKKTIKDAVEKGCAEGKRSRKSTKESVELDEGGVKAALEDFMYSIPKAAIEELRPIMKQKASTKKFSQITKILKKHGFEQKFMGSYASNVVNDYYDTFFGE